MTGEGGIGSRTAPGTGSRPSVTTQEDRFSQDDVLTATTITTPSSHTFYRQQPQSRDKLSKSDDLLLDKDPVVDHLAFSPAGSAGLDLNNNNQSKDSIGNGSCNGMNGGSTSAGTATVSRTPSTRKTYSLAKARAPRPCVITGFCSISKTPIKPSGEPSPQDFLGEADLPYPLPSTLHDRQTRQRKRAEQLRQLKIREECEAQEKSNSINNNNRRRVIRRRGNSFSAGMIYSPASTSASTSASQLALSLPSSSSNSTPNSPAMLSHSPRMQSSQQHQSSTTSFRSAAWHQQRLSLNQHLKRFPSSPIRGSSSVNNSHLLNRYSTSNIGQGSKDKLAMLSGLSSTPPPPPRRRVVFDLENIQVFEYDVSGGDDWSSSSDSSPSSPTMPPASTNGRDSYVRYCPSLDCSSSSGSSDEESSSPCPARVPTPARDLKSKAFS
ncbi:hypothetical protein BGZ47_002680 [Haplosporangium gracile]|nr:hypothetical protein BGZ47_002680 [Haplosporangium gracile]